MNRPRLLVAALLMELAFAGAGCGSASLRQADDGGRSDAGSGGTSTGGHAGALGTAGNGAAPGPGGGGAGGTPQGGVGGGGRGGAAGQPGAAGSGAGGAGASGPAGAGGSAGHGGSGGSAGTGGTAGHGGTGGSAGTGGTAGHLGTGGAPGTGGTAGTRGGAGAGGAGGQPGSGGSAGGAAGAGGMTSAGGAGGMTCGFPMPNPASASLPNPASYDVSTAGVVLDNVTGLAWERTVSASSYTQTEAAAYCSSNRLGSWTDWRLPSVLELGTLMDFIQAQQDPAIDPVAFPSTPEDNTRASWFQTSTPVAGDATKSWYVDFQNGNNFIDAKGTGRVRCVRTAKVMTARCYSPGARFVASTTGGISTKLDSATGLVWQLGVGPQPMVWSDAVSYCQGLAGSFRLPSIKEMQTIIDYTVAAPGPTIDAAFPAGPANYEYWTSSPLAGVPTGAWLMAVDTGSLSWNGQDALYLARCVH